MKVRGTIHGEKVVVLIDCGATHNYGVILDYGAAVKGKGFGEFSYYFFTNRMSREYELGVEAFIQFGFRNAKGFSTIRCPCLKCGNRLPKDLADISRCPKCNISRWKTSKNSNEEIKGVSAKQLWKVDGVLKHPTDTPSWRLVDHLRPDFGSKPRNLRLGLSTDGINPYRDLSTKHSCWPVIATIYNLPSWLSSLIDDLKLMWEEGVQCFDAHRNERFTLRAVLLWTIIDFPVYGNLCGCSVKGYKACPICEEETSSIRLPHGKKNAYMRHRKYLPSHHPYRRQKKAFDGNQEHGTPPLPLSGERIYNRLKDKTFP
ncbi:transposase [Cucumis melo var. makuwa]|uniref:Transposase n=1 Tax=Cucumis melo var. makuwa TaxID=1194695 RepID=A0A5A7UII5_CUCMM|nr:transposase [Cucumis melo var. makuwa]